MRSQRPPEFLLGTRITKRAEPAWTAFRGSIIQGQRAISFVFRRTRRLIRTGEISRKPIFGRAARANSQLPSQLAALNPKSVSHNMNWLHSSRGFVALFHWSRILFLSIFVSLTLMLSCVQCVAQTKRLVLIKCDGLPYDVIDRFVKERDQRTGKSALPWIDYIFYQRGARLSNFYVRGMSLSGPSWTLLDTGQHLQIKGNVEFDRYTLHSYDYLNFIPFYIRGAMGSRVDMPGVDVLDSIGVPLLVDAYPHNENYISFSLYQRGLRYSTLNNGLQNRFKKAPKDLFDEWTMGFEMRSTVTDQLLRELLEKLNNPKIRYLDLYMADFDHVGHHNNDVQSHLFVLKEMDSVLGQIWSAIQKSSLASETALVVVSDHGFNTDERIYSQGYNLVKLLGSSAGGGHHVVTKRRVLLEYAI